jgi:CheY-like chemotaxis protein
LERTITERIQIELDVDSSKNYLIHGDPAQLQQVLTNLAINARDAMPEGGKLTLKLDKITIDPTVSTPVPELETGDWVVLSISDTGTGIPAEILPHIYEPFFTTKTAGNGTGLGLAQVYGIVKQHAGDIQVDSQPNAGTTFSIYLPAIAVHSTTENEDNETKAPAGQGETILVVEDDANVCEVIRSMLEVLGYQVLTASDGTEGLAVVRNRKDEIDLVLTDVIMPNMDGVTMTQSLGTEEPDLKILMMTGYARDKNLTTEFKQQIAGWVTKPPRAHQLAQAILEALRA